MLLSNDKLTSSRWLFDQQYRSQFATISGSDEAGRGAMAGPVVVASVIVDQTFFDPRIKDSKKLSPKLRDELYELVIANVVDYQVSIIEADQVDVLNPKQASVVGMKTTIKNLTPVVECALVDGEQLKDFEAYHPQQVIKGDDLSFSIACASIIAKVTRDRIMDEYGKMYPGYGFEKHKGYVTKFHYEQTAKLGVLPIHRLSYKPIKKLLTK